MEKTTSESQSIERMNERKNRCMSERTNERNKACNREVIVLQIDNGKVTDLNT